MNSGWTSSRVVGRRVLIALLGVFVLGGCAADGSPTGFFDQGTNLPDQALAADQAVIFDLAVPDQGVPPALPGFPVDPVAYGAFESAFTGTNVADCYSGAGGLRCDEGPCALLATCCVGDGACGGAGQSDAWPVSLSFNGCASGSAAASCLTGVTSAPVSPSVTSTVESDGMRGGGGVTGEGGLIVGGAIDLARERAALSVVYRHPVSCGGASCLETAGVAIVDDDALTPGVVPAAASLVYVGARGKVVFLVGGAEIDAWATVDEDDLFELISAPDGTLSVLRDQMGTTETLVTGVGYEPPRRARLVLHGRNVELLGARVADVVARRTLSDMPAAWDDAVAVPTPMPPSLTTWSPVAPAIVDYGGTLVFAVEHEGAIYRGTYDEITGFVVDESLRIRAVDDSAVSGEEGTVWVGDPAWWVEPTGETLLCYGFVLGNDGGQGVRCRRGDEGPLGDLPLVSTVLPLGDAAGDPADSAASPTLIRLRDRLVMIARVTDESGDEYLEVYTAPYSSVTGVPLPVFGLLRDNGLREMTRIPAAELGARALGAPSLVARDGAYRLYYASRRGARWTISAAASDEGIAWRDLGEVLLGGAGFSELGVRDPEVFVDGDTITLMHVGVGALGTTIARATRPRPTSVSR